MGSNQSVNSNTSSGEAQKGIKKHIGVWKQKLIDFSKRNQLLYFKPRVSLSVEVTESSNDVFKKLVLDDNSLVLKELVQAFNTTEFDEASGDPVMAVVGDDVDSLDAQFDPGFDPNFALDDMMAVSPNGEEQKESLDRPFLQTNKDEKSLNRALKNLRQRAKASLNEQGVNILFLSLYFLNWHDKSNNDMAKSPLILVPVSLERKGLNAPFELNLIDDEIIVNPTLSYKLKHDYGIKLPDLSAFTNNSTIDTLETFEKFFAEIKKSVSGDERSEWEVLDEASLSLFSFAKLSMYKDLEENEKKIVNHPLIQQICGFGRGDEKSGPFIGDLSGGLISAKDIDTKIDANQASQILDADSSQQEAIYSAKSGESFVLQGPPGTGKSQTISNIIAESLSQNKKVLFVSEKKAALDVVFKRLKASNLDKFCFELHGSKQKKSDIIANLRKNLDEVKDIAMSSPRHPYIESINGIKADIHKGISELHKIRQPINKSLYEIYACLAELQSDSEGNPLEQDKLDFTISNIERLTEKELAQLDYLFTQLEKKPDILNAYPDFVWRNASPSNLSFELELQIKNKFADFKSIVSKVQDFANPISQQYFNKEVKNIRQLKWLAEACELAVDSPFPKQEWFDKAKLEQVSNVAIEAKKNTDELVTSKEGILSKYSENFLELDHKELLNKFTTEYVGVFRFLNIGYWKSMSKIKKTALYNETRNLSQIVDDLEEAIRISGQSQEMETKDPEFQLALGDFYQKFDTNWEETLTAIKWVRKVLNKLDSGDVMGEVVGEGAHMTVSSAFLGVVSNDTDSEDFREFKLKADQLIQAWGLVKYHLEFYKSIFTSPNIDIFNVDFDELSEHLDELTGNVQKIEEWIEFKHLREHANKSGLKHFIDAMLNNPSEENASDLRNKFYRKFYQLWIDKIEIESGCMRSFSGQNQAVLIDKFNDLDHKQMDKVKIDLSKKLAMNWIEYASNPGNQDALQVLSTEINKKKRHKPARILIEEIPELLLTLKPCWMMSPLSASQFIDQNAIKFDIVIFDEASQIRTEDAICSIARGDQLVLAGDTKQLPPTDFFSMSFEDASDEYTEESNRNFESVLDECSVFLKNRTLNWHYRSCHESLISFSNESFYDNKLITFPSPVQNSPEMGVHYELVEDGTYERGARYNRKESKRVAQAILDHFEANPDMSLGVIAFSEAQQMSIERELEALLRKDPDKEHYFFGDKEEAFFIKNLENVQGDERDVIFFSIGYAKDKKGVLSHNFGPLNKEGGHRRLNVAVTRAKSKLKVFSSISSGDIDLSRTSSQGAALLKKYLEYAQNCENGLVDSSSTLFGSEYDMEFSKGKITELEESIARAIEAQGYKVKRYMGTSNYRVDLAVYKEEDEKQKYLLAIETDGFMYKSANTTRDRERLRTQVLRSLGWNVHRIYARDWIRSPQLELDKVLDKLP